MQVQQIGILSTPRPKENHEYEHKKTSSPNEERKKQNSRVANSDVRYAIPPHPSLMQVQICMYSLMKPLSLLSRLILLIKLSHRDTDLPVQEVPRADLRHGDEGTVGAAPQSQAQACALLADGLDLV